MNTFKLTGDLNHLYFQNLERIDDSIIYKNVLSKLKEQPEVTLSSEEMLPYTDVTKGLFKSIPFSVALDLDYGTIIHCGNQNCLNEIELLLQNN